MHHQRRGRRHLRLSVPRVALQPHRSGAGRPCQGVAASVRHHVRERRRDDRCSDRMSQLNSGHRPPASPRRIRRQRSRTPTTFRDMSTTAAVAHLVDYEGRPDDVDARIGRPDHAQVTISRDLFAPDIDIDDARQRWLFRMIHTRRPLQEKMALFWHNHFATAYSKLAADSGTDAGGQDARAQARRAARAAGTDRALPPVRARQLPRPPAPGGAGSRDAGVARRQEQHQSKAAGELRPRGHGAVHGRRRQLHRGGRLRGGARVHRLEPAASPRATAATTTGT